MINEKPSVSPQQITVTGFDTTKITEVLLYKIGGIRFLRIALKAGAITTGWTNISIPLNSADVPQVTTPCICYKGSTSDSSMNASATLASSGTLIINSDKANTNNITWSTVYFAQFT